MKLDKEEKALLDSLEKGEWKSIKNVRKEINGHMEYAKATFRALHLRSGHACPTLVSLAKLRV